MVVTVSIYLICLGDIIFQLIHYMSIELILITNIIK